jgi:hypothetical protein
MLRVLSKSGECIHLDQVRARYCSFEHGNEILDSTKDK